MGSKKKKKKRVIKVERAREAVSVIMHSTVCRAVFILRGEYHVFPEYHVLVRRDCRIVE
jgi:hypothetical protein